MVPKNLFFATAFTALEILLFSCGCGRPRSEGLQRRFAEWYVGLSDRDHAALVEADLSPRELDSIAHAARPQKTATGKLIRTLRDGNGTEYNVGIYCPHEIPSTKRLPLIIYLHGGIGTTLNTKGEHAYEMLMPLTDSIPLLLASPSANRHTPWWSYDGMERILQTVRYMTLHYPVDPDRIVTAGVSDGATGAYAVANAACGPFAGFIAVSGFGGMLPRLGMQLVPDNLMQRPIYNVNAGKDHLYPIKHVNAFLDRLDANGVGLVRKDYPDEKHGFDYRDKEWASLVKLLRRWRRPASTGIAWTFIPGVPNYPPGLAAWKAPKKAAIIRGHWERNLLHLSASGLTSVCFAVPDTTPKGYRVAIKGSRGKMHANASTEHYLSYMRIRCRPSVGSHGIIRISF
ncbi:MAG: hypothetical protein GF344_11385 [Chitinivibrionales bacterium]|nr:hypothetical protein [Chitinivibrionales bacterium]MBD3357403.1 hypothetical protein [Chitinivibrionales bacterium]